MQATVDDLRALIHDTADANTLRERQLQDTLQRLTDQAAGAENDNMTELLPVLHAICADYGQRQNNQVNLWTAYLDAKCIADESPVYTTPLLPYCC